MSKTYSAGIVTAYGAAKRAGYQGTYEDFCRQQAGYAGNAAAVEQAKTDAINAKNDAVTAKNTAVSAKDDAVSAKDTAVAKASEASASATNAGQSATSASQSATSAETSAANAHGFALDAEQSAQDISEEVQQIATNTADISQLKAGLVDINDALLSETTADMSTWAKRYIYSTGNTGSSSAYQAYAINVEDVDELVLTSAIASSRSSALIAFYSIPKSELTNGTAISDNCVKVGPFHESTDTEEYTEEYSVPNDALSALVTCAVSYGAPKCEFYKIVDAKNSVNKESTIYAEEAHATYLSHRYLSPTGLPYSTASNTWNLYKLDVSDCESVKIETYRTATGSTDLRLYSFVSTEFTDVTSTSETASSVVGVGDLIAPTGETLSINAVKPDGAKTMFIVCASEYAEYPKIIKYHYGYFKDLKNVSDLVAGVQALEEKTDGYVNYKASPYYRAVRWDGGSLDEYYHSADDGVSLFPNTITAQQYFAMFNALVADYPNYAESHEMGLASDGTTMMYYYTLNPLTNQDSETYKRPKFIISAGQHGFEKTANFGVFWFVKNLLENWRQNDSLAYMRNHVQFVILPMLNPSGFDNDNYVNGNGVNLNRNWGTTAWSKGTQGTTTYGGEAPFDQPETQYARDVILANLDALWLCDFHNNGQAAPSSQAGYLWHSFALMTYNDPYFKTAINAAKYHIDEITGHLYADYPEQCQYALSGTFTDNNAPSHQGLITAYAREQNIMAATIEGGAAFIESGSRYSSPVHHMNADLLGNWIRCLVSHFSKFEN